MEHRRCTAILHEFPPNPTHQAAEDVESGGEPLQALGPAGSPSFEQTATGCETARKAII